MSRTLAAGLLLLAALGLPLVGPLGERLRAGASACAEGRCCCGPSETDAASVGEGAAADAGDCCSSSDAPAQAQLAPSCTCGAHGGPQHASAHGVSLDLPAAGVALIQPFVSGISTSVAAAPPRSDLSGPDPPPPRRRA